MADVEDLTEHLHHIGGRHIVEFIESITEVFELRIIEFAFRERLRMIDRHMFSGKTL